ncbi:endonuclease/exonuclease/phosphatase family domain-containing protein 1-like [Pocillopora verrucosa]|uniref:endonuclease/exonuclease/phosphatase family domain-containing protein 1-like n=1 Tax=Pocillopora verrucosa TaxID=203993 RepID=UPI00333E6507
MGCKCSKFYRRTRNETKKTTGIEIKGTGSGINDERNQESGSELEERQPLTVCAEDQEAKNRLTQVGINEEIANELLLLRGKGSLKTTRDIVAVLEKYNADYKVAIEQLDGNTLVRVNSLGNLSVEKVEKKGIFSFKSVEEKGFVDSEEKIDINTASVELLESIKGIGSILAGRIVAHREEHGPFAELGDIVSVIGVSKKLLDNVMSQVTVTSAKIPKIPKITPYLINNNTLRIASWNLQSFSSDKADNAGVKEVICCTVLENGLDILAIQEIGDTNALIKIKDELNSPTSETVKTLKTVEQHWECCISDISGKMFRVLQIFLYAVLFSGLVSREIRYNLGELSFRLRETLAKILLHFTLFTMSSTKISLFCVVIVPLTNRFSFSLSSVGEKNMMVLGDFNLGPDLDMEEFDAMREGGLANLISASTFTNISTKNMEGSKNYDNIWISKHAKSNHFTGKSGVIRERLTHPSIPDGRWSWNGVVSDHCPVWAEFYCDRDFDDTEGLVSVEDIAIDGKEIID